MIQVIEIETERGMVVFPIDYLKLCYWVVRKEGVAIVSCYGEEWNFIGEDKDKFLEAVEGVIEK